MVYLAKDYKTGLIKIGFSENPQVREKTLRAETPEIDIFCILLGGLNLEKKLHQEYKNQRIRGEWFALEEEDINNIISSYPNLFRKTDENFLSPAATRLLEIIKENKSNDIFSPTFLANNIFSDTKKLRQTLDELKKKRILKYTWKRDIEIKFI